MTSHLPLSFMQDVRHASRIVVLSHTIPDGDAIGSLVALHTALAPKVTAWLPPQAPPSIHRLAGSILPPLPDHATLASALAAADTVIVVDCSEPSRTGLDPDLLAMIESRTIVIDHHLTDRPWGAVVLRDPAAPSTTALLAPLLHAGGWLTPSVATWLLYGLYTDTVHFTNGDRRAFESAWLLIDAGADISQASRWASRSMTLAEIRAAGHIIAHSLSLIFPDSVLITLDATVPSHIAYGALRFVQHASDVTMVIVLTEQYDPDGTLIVRGSIRTRPPRTALPIAEALGGGGHLHAAGFRMVGPLSDAIARVQSVLTALDPTAVSSPLHD